MVKIFIFDGVTLQTSHWLSSVCWEERFRDTLCQMELTLNETVPGNGDTRYSPETMKEWPGRPPLETKTMSEVTSSLRLQLTI